MLNQELTDKEKIILAIILYLSEETESCFASNKYIANIVNVTSDRVSKIISSLRDKNYIKVKLKYKTDSKEIEQRQIIPIVENINRHSQKLHNQVGNIKAEYKEKEFDIEWTYKSKIRSLERENNHLNKVVDKFYDIVEKFINWICQKSGIGESKELVR